MNVWVSYQLHGLGKMSVFGIIMSLWPWMKFKAREPYRKLQSWQASYYLKKIWFENTNLLASVIKNDSQQNKQKYPLLDHPVFVWPNYTIYHTFCSNIYTSFNLVDYEQRKLWLSHTPMDLGLCPCYSPPPLHHWTDNYVKENGYEIDQTNISK